MKALYKQYNGDLLPSYYHNLIKLYSSKSDDWKTEDEFRYLIHDNNFGEAKRNYYVINNFINCIESIFIGEKQDVDSLKLIKCIKDKLTPNTNFYIPDEYANEIALEDFLDRL